MPPGSRGRIDWTIPILLVLAMLLTAGLAFNLANLNAGGEALPTPPGPAAPTPSLWGVILSNVLTSVLAGTFLALLVFTVVYALLSRNRMSGRPVTRPPRWWDTVGILVSFLFLALLLYLWPRLVHNAAGGTTGQSTPGNSTFNATAVPAVAGIPLGILLAASVILALVVVSVLLRAGASLRRMAPPKALASRRRAAAAAVEATIAELQLGGDVRAAILSCYRHFCLLLGSRGIVEQDPLTPRELEDRALTQLAVSPESAESLTSLFEEARYSTHVLGDADRDRAVESLARIRAALGG